MLNLSEMSHGTGPFCQVANEMSGSPKKGLRGLPLAGTCFPSQGVHYSLVHKMLYQEKVSILKKVARGIAFLCNALWLEQNGKGDRLFLYLLIMKVIK